MKNTIYLIFLLLFTVSCGNQNDTNNKSHIKDTGNQAVNAETAQSAISADESVFKGEKVYNRVCLSCHQHDGSGVPMMYPPLIESDYISGNTDSLIILILEGLSGPFVVKGEEYNSIMPPQKDGLNDNEISDLINFLRSSFGNSGEFVKPGSVASIRE